MLLKPYTATVNTNGQAVISIGHSLANIKWKIMLIGFGLGQNAPSPQVGLHVNGTPFGASQTFQTSVFAGITGEPPYAMEMTWYGPPYFYLSSGDVAACGVMGAQPGDQFTATALIEEVDAYAPESMGS
jgi:hypothetical protein